MPHAHQPVPPGADDDRRDLPARGAPEHGGEVVRGDLQRVEEVVQVLNFGNGAQAAHRHANGLADDGGFPNAGVGNPQFAVFGLQALEALVHAAQIAHIFAKGDDARVAGQGKVEELVEHLMAGDFGRGFGIHRRHFGHVQRRGRPGAVKV